MPDQPRQEQEIGTAYRDVVAWWKAAEQRVASEREAVAEALRDRQTALDQKRWAEQRVSELEERLRSIDSLTRLDHYHTGIDLDGRLERIRYEARALLDSGDSE